MLDRIDDLFVEQARIGGVEHSPKARHAIEQFQMPVGVPSQGRDPVARLNAKPHQGLSDLRRAASKACIVIAPERLVDEPGHDGPRAMGTGSELHDLRDQQRRLLHQSRRHLEVLSPRSDRPQSGPAHRPQGWCCPDRSPRPVSHGWSWRRAWQGPDRWPDAPKH